MTTTHSSVTTEAFCFKLNFSWIFWIPKAYPKPSFFLPFPQNPLFLPFTQNCILLHLTGRLEDTLSLPLFSSNGLCFLLNASFSSDKEIPVNFFFLRVPKHTHILPLLPTQDSQPWHTATPCGHYHPSVPPPRSSTKLSLQTLGSGACTVQCT